MTFSKKAGLALIAFSVILSGPSQAEAQQSAGGLACKYIPPIQEGYLNQHIKHKKMTPELEKRVVNQILKRLDPLKVYLLKKDEDKIKKMFSGIFKKTQNANCAPIYNANAYVLEKIQDRVAFVKSFLGKKYKFDKNIKINLDSDKRKRFASKKEMNAFHKKYIHFQISNYLLSDTKIDEAKKNVVKNYERILKKLKKETEQDQLAEYLDAFAHSLDPHSTFFSADALDNFRIQMSLSLEGIGATLSWKDGFTVVESLVPGGAADKSGQIKPKDKIVAVRQDKVKKAENVIEMELNDVVKKIRGKKGTKVFLSVLRKEGGETKRLEIKLVRDKISLEDEAAQISYHKKKVGSETKLIGLINLPSFYADGRRNGRSAAKDVKKLLREAKAKKVDGIVLDLSSNGGGSLDDAVKIGGLFIKTGNIVKQSFPDPNRPAIALADVDATVDYKGPLVILTSRASASASEIVSGALKDYGRAVIVGADHTFGKGTVQSVRDLPKQLGALKVTVGMFFTAGGYSTQHRGVDADVVLPSVFSNEDVGEKTYDYSLPPKKLPSFISSDAYVHEGPSKWQIIDKKTIAALGSASKARVSKSDKFKEVLDDIKKSKERGKTLDLAEVMKEKTEKKDKKKDSDKVLSKKEKLKKYFERAEVEESLNVALDLILLQDKQPITLGAHQLKRKASSVVRGKKVPNKTQ
jgi:carboxyl-terminal processing protease